jgi:hypothetical protein
VSEKISKNAIITLKNLDEAVLVLLLRHLKEKTLKLNNFHLIDNELIINR